MGTLHFKKNLVDEAKRIIEWKKATGDKKTAEDLAELLNVISNINQYADLYLQGLDQRLRQEYNTIELLEQIPTLHGPKSTNSEPLISETERRLVVDYFGICLDALLKEEIIKKVEDFIEN